MCIGVKINTTILYVFLLGLITINLAAQNVGINNNGSSPDASAVLDLDVTNRGLLIPRMTTNERNGIVSSANSLLIYNTTTECFEAYHAGTSSWVNISCLGCQLPASFSASASTGITETTFDANWSASSGATDYFLDVDDNSDFSSPLAGYNNLNVGNVTTHNVTGLTCNTTYYYRLRASNACGATSNSNTITLTTGVCYTGCITANSTIIQDVVGSAGRTWMDRNLGASQVAASGTDALSYGCLYQWGRGNDGHENRGSTTTVALSSGDSPGHSNYITSSTAPFDWRSPQNDNLWQGAGGTNNPCPSGYRLPTEPEWSAEEVLFSPNNAAGAYASPLKLPVAGTRDRVIGTLINVGIYGSYWSSSIDGVDARHMGFNSSTAGTPTNNRAHGFSIRCIKD